MPQMIVSESARRGLQRLQDFLKNKNALAAKKAAEVLIRGIRQLAALPNIGRPVEHLPLEYQELVIEFGSSGYVMLYRHDELTDRVVILTVKHQKEAGYQNP
ncbi:type II toxin-antitoxin system RelE/ParE family toxin [Pectobacterium aroidearum]|uniref:type II toxin-antitoxin system RelE/ParE family toxin n=1 Tax=Pectobacterium aroidearum TaxID=1201031 RepID=UPI0015DE57A9|nr:type II toxin-antitoxin system RelE/ParE family toxin [Pectobacterium aroidearum]MBA0206061.1 type II toxin-antitoxin system RelE/ParE family toxin [Pectobacterium aroidearum]